ncbi:MAG TPA: CocE/NonD family hydrolase [Chloroflexota bacterium]|nr:CocE/NonD family hydrolase [Chloroflexota bacterium]
MNTRIEFPHAVRELEHVWIPLADGCKLAARLWLPVDAEQHPVPAILEYLPYRKNDLTAQRDALQHPYFAGHGYAAIRVDMRGSGDSDGLLLNEYLPQEQDDAVEALAWIAAQPWCSGAVGMIGISWGGFNGLQVAARRPPALKAVISLCSTDDRYADDVHFVGGCLLADDSLPWGSAMLGRNALPPDPAIVGDGWRALWQERLAGSPPFIEEWLRHQRRDAYWQQGSVCEDYAAITCPVYVVGGSADGYTNAIPRLLAGLPGPRKGLIGPWAHTYPEMGVPGPAIGFLQECVRWWDHWLKGQETGIMDEPMLRAWMQEAVEPRPFYAERPGRWVAEASWPSSRIAMRGYVLNAGALAETPEAETRQQIRGSQRAGLAAGVFCPYGSPTDLPLDQREEDALSLTFTSAPLDTRVEILGFPRVTLTLAADQPRALVCVRLCDVAPDGASTLITPGLLNLTHRDSHEHPTPLEPGQRYTVTVQLNAIAQALPAGHRWRLALSPTYWPWTWPSPEPVTLSIFTGAASRLDLPVRAPRQEDAALAPFGPPETARRLAVQVLGLNPGARTITHDTATGRYELTVNRPYIGGARLLDSGREYTGATVDTYTIVEGEPLSAQVQSRSTITMSADATHFHVTNALDAYEGNVRVFARTWTFTVPRDLI